MNFNLKEAIEILDRTPNTIEYFLTGLSDEWINCNEGEGSWNAIEVIAHLIECEKNNWIPRIEAILKDKNQSFPPFNRYAHLNKPERMLDPMLSEFKSIRIQNINNLKILVDSETQLELTGMHPEFGAVKLRELISTWVVHDLTHINQIMRVMAERYRTDVGPWIEYLSILKKR